MSSRSRIAPLANRVVPSKVAVGTSAVVASAASGSKVWTMLEADKANTQPLYFGGASTLTTTDGFGELAAGEVLTIPGAAVVYVIAGGASQNVRVLAGLA